MYFNGGAVACAPPIVRDESSRVFLAALSSNRLRFADLFNGGAVFA